jgi:hypothetical protein
MGVASAERACSGGPLRNGASVAFRLRRLSGALRDIYFVAARDENGLLVAYAGTLFELFPQVFLPAAFDGPPLRQLSREHHG